MMRNGATEEVSHWLRRFPNTAIGIALGLAGNSILWEHLSAAQFARDALGEGPLNASWFFWCAGLVVFTVVTILYACKALCHFDVVLAECRHPVRCHFFNGPHIAMLMLSLGTPAAARNETLLRVVWVVAAVLQCVLVQTFYTRWLFSKTATLATARPPYLLSTVGWFLLSALGSAVNLEDAWHLPLPSWVFGAGVATYSLVVVGVFMSIASAPTEKGQPALFLLVAPPSVAATALVPLNGGVYGAASSAIFGYNLLIVMVLLRLSPQFARKPVLLGTYWAYVFPLAALAASSVRYATIGRPSGTETAPAEALAWVLVGVASLMLLSVFLRMLWHQVQVMRGHERWDDPVARECDEARRTVGADIEGGGGTVAAQQVHVAVVHAVEAMARADGDGERVP